MYFLLEHLDLYIYFGQTFMELILLIKNCSQTEPLPRIKFNRFRVLSALQHRSSAIIRSHSIRSQRKYFCNDPKVGDPGSLDNIKLCFLSNCCRYQLKGFQLAGIPFSRYSEERFISFFEKIWRYLFMDRVQMPQDYRVSTRREFTFSQ